MADLFAATMDSPNAAAVALTQGWAGQPQWRILQVSGLGDGLPFLRAWAAWQADPQRPRLLHFTAITADAAALCTPARPALSSTLQPLAEALRARCYGLLPGVHRLGFENGQVLLTLWVGDCASLLRQQTSTADSVALHSDAHSGVQPPWDGHTLKALARHCRRGTHLLAGRHDAALRQSLQQAGFELPPLLPPDTSALHAVFNPRWEPRHKPQTALMHIPAAPTALIIGAGLAGSAAAYSLAQRGWQVTVLGAGDAPADGASGLPAGLFCPHVSPDDSVLSRLSRSGVRQTLQRLRDLCHEGQDWHFGGVLEHCTDGGTGLPAHWEHGAGTDWSHRASHAQLQAAGLPEHTVACWHAQAGWVRPSQLVQAQLNHPSIRFVPRSTVARLQPAADGTWHALDADDTVLAQAHVAVVACGPATPSLLPLQTPWYFQAVRGQITLGWHTPENAAALPPFSVNGNGNLVTHVPLAQGTAWVMGSTFERNVSALPIAAADQSAAHAVNHGKLSHLLPASAGPLAPWFDPSSPHCAPTWGQVRCTSHDRLPIAGPVPHAPPGLWVCTAMGARGLTLSVLCGELMAAQLHGEPLPLDAKLAAHLGTERLARQKPPATSDAT